MGPNQPQSQGYTILSPKELKKKHEKVQTGTRYLTDYQIKSLPFFKGKQHNLALKNVIFTMSGI